MDQHFDISSFDESCISQLHILHAWLNNKSYLALDFLVVFEETKTMLSPCTIVYYNEILWLCVDEILWWVILQDFNQ